MELEPEDDLSVLASSLKLSSGEPAEEEEEEIFSGAEDRSVATVLDYFAEYSAAKERHDSGISGSPVSISDAEPLQDGAAKDTAPPTAAVTASTTAKDAVKDASAEVKYAAGGSPEKKQKAAAVSGPEGRLKKRRSRSQRRDDRSDR